MSSMWFMADEATSVGAAADETVVDFPVTAPGPELAWSQADVVGSAETVGFQPWRSVWGSAGVLVAAGVVVAVVVGVVGWVWLRPDGSRAPAQAASSSAPVAVPPPVVATPTPVQELSPDDQYILGLQRSGIELRSRANAITTGHSVCTMLGNNWTYDAIAERIIRNNPSFTAAMGHAAVVVAVGAYCPDLATG